MLTSSVDRMSKIVSRVEIYKKISKIHGDIVECGVFKGSSLSQFIKLRNLFSNAHAKKIIAFDSFGTFPDLSDIGEKKYLKKFINDAGEKSITKKDLINILKSLNLYENIELVKGDITKTAGTYLKNNSHLKISLLNIDVDLYKPTIYCLKNFYSHVVKGGIILLDDYGSFPGANKAIDEFTKDKNIVIKTLPFSYSMSYFIKK